MKKIGKLIISRHHESEYNKLGLWTGSRDVGLTPYGKEMAKKMGVMLRNFCIDVYGGSHVLFIDRVFVTGQMRTLQTYENMLISLKSNPSVIAQGIQPEKSPALNERDYGDYTGKNKWEVKKEMGEKAFDQLRRGWNYPVPNGETLEMVSERAVPFYLQIILPLLVSGKNVFVVASGNSIRTLMKYIENIQDTNIGEVEMPFGGILIYDVDAGGHIIDKTVLQVESQVNA